MSCEEKRAQSCAAKAALKASGFKTCARCNETLPLANFRSRERMKRGKLVTAVEARCKPCFSIAQSEMYQTSEFREKNSAYKRSVAYKQWRKTYRERDSVKESEANYVNSDRGKASQKRRKQRYYGSEAWRAQQDRQNDVRRKRYAQEHVRRLNVALANVVSRMIRGTRDTSRTLYSYTEFEDAHDLLAHLEPLVAMREGMTMENYGTVWHIDHRIAKCWYANDEDDIKRCWSRRNLAPEFGIDNIKKNRTIIDNVCIEVGSAYWPKSWGGKIPNAATKARMNAALKMD